MIAKRTFDRRANPSRDLPHGQTVPRRISRLHGWIIVLLGTGLTGFAGSMVGHDVWFGPFFLLAIGFAAWALGWREAVGVGTACFGIMLLTNGLSLYPYGTIAALWNLGMRIVAVLMFIGLLDHARTSYERQWHLARTDPLTGALNRQAFFELAADSSFSREWNLLAYADLDGLKKHNDVYGHAAGDQCLKMFVNHVRQAIRKQDHFARIGGDEFLAHFRVPDENAAKAIAIRLHHEMQMIASHVHSNLGCSVGALILPPGMRMIDREVRIADELMYKAKRHGAGLTVATLRERRGTEYILQHWNADQLSGDSPVFEANAGRWEAVDLETAA